MYAFKHAVVIGGSIAGLWSARVLADFFDRVTVLDRDHYPDTPEPRKGVPQGRHIHVLLARGQQILEELFPGLYEELLSQGIEKVRWLEDIRTYGLDRTWAQPFAFGQHTMGASRLLIEWRMRERLLQNPKITFVEGRVVSALLTDDAKTRITGVKAEGIGAERASVGEETYTADFVVDASGRESRAPEWLQSLGYEAPEEVVVDSNVGYATRVYKRPENANIPWKMLMIQDREGNAGCTGMIYPMENGQWMALLGVVHRPLPDDPESFLECARSLPEPDFYNAIKDAEALSPVYRYQRTANQLRHYGALKRMPESFVVIGDAVCAFNPIYGQGMTVSGMEAMLLKDELKRGYDAGFSLRFHQKVANLINAPWQLATSEDARNATPDQKIGFVTKFLTIYTNHMFAMIGNDYQVGKAFFSVLHLIKGPAAMFAPAVAFKVFRHMLKSRMPAKAPVSKPIVETA